MCPNTFASVDRPPHLLIRSSLILDQTTSRDRCRPRLHRRDALRGPHHVIHAFLEEATDAVAGGTPPLHPEIRTMAIRYKLPPSHLSSSPTSASVEEREEFGAHSTMNGAIKVGAWGGNGGSAYDMGPAYRIISVTVFSGDVVDAVDVTFTYYGKTETRHCGGSGGNPHEIVLEEDEYLVGMAGEVASYHGVVVVGKLGFTTNKKAYGPFGNTGGTPFSLPIAAGKISGFFGRGGQFLDAIGVYLEP
ncbi:Mannose glucose-specific lectin [Musa troglodytarum]|uniref:Mannose glucose-specific lectin n=2 Tax=Musa troglodytarum TaxID=320322 RepID=A0A9E7HZX6_9LILI|nr:Mannose glucose-specific lectin [Musa troglodytarum]